MAFSLNKVQLIGNLGADPEVRYTQAGKPVASLSVATSESWNNQQGERQEKTEWHRVSVWGKLAEIAQQYLRKGSKVYIEGKLQTRKWIDKQGQERYSTDIDVSGFNSQMIILDSRNAGGAGRDGGYGASSGGYGPGPQPSAAPAAGGAAAGAAAGAGGPGGGAGGPGGGGFGPADEFGASPDFDDDIPF